LLTPPDRAHFTFRLQGFHRPPGVEPQALYGPVHQVQVYRFEAQTVQAFSASGQGCLVAVVAVPQLGLDEEIVAE
jgi:hypothetical protein